MKRLMVALLAVVLSGCDTDLGILFSVPQIKQLSNYWESVAKDLLKNEFFAGLESIEVDYQKNEAQFYFVSGNIAFSMQVKYFSCYDSFSFPGNERLFASYNTATATARFENAFDNCADQNKIAPQVYQQLRELVEMPFLLTKSTSVYSEYECNWNSFLLPFTSEVEPLGQRCYSARRTIVVALTNRTLNAAKP